LGIYLYRTNKKEITENTVSKPPIVPLSNVTGLKAKRIIAGKAHHDGLKKFKNNISV